MSENPVTVFAFSLFVLILLAALFGPWSVPYDPLATDAGNALQPPTWEHWFGTDQLGRDVFSRVLVATRLDLGIAVSAVALSLVLGSALGAAAGFWGGWTDRVIGLGVRPPDAEWGIMGAEGATYIVSGEWWMALFPGTALMLAVFCFNLLGDGLRDLVDPLNRT
jgi:ABC-type dipeptide/oligopeptide/nickel transport system permease subunit